MCQHRRGSRVVNVAAGTSTRADALRHRHEALEVLVGKWINEGEQLLRQKRVGPS